MLLKIIEREVLEVMIVHLYCRQEVLYQALPAVVLCLLLSVLSPPPPLFRSAMLSAFRMSKHIGGAPETPK